jgi:hypothetical protein
MITAAQLALDAYAAGERGQFMAWRMASVPPWQFRVRFDDLCAVCPDRVDLPVERRPGNALNVEIGTPLPRCAQRSPDGRGLAWIASGGSWLAYGHCRASACPRTKDEAKR